MTPITAATALLVAGGVGGIAWMLWPILRPRAEAPRDAQHDEIPDAAERLAVLRDRGSQDDDVPEPWTERAPLLPDGPRRVPWELTAAEILPVLRDDRGVFLLPVAGSLLATDPEAPAVIRGRRQGRAFHAVRLRDGLYLDLVELVRTLPVVGVELRAREVTADTVELFDDLGSIRAADDELAAVAPWLAGVPGPRVLPEGDGVRRWAFRIGEHTLEVEAWMPAVAAGIRSDRLAWAGLVRWSGHGGIVESGATPVDVLAHLVDDPAGVRSASLEAWRWDRAELAELAAVGHYLEQQEIAVLPFLADALADRVLPVPDLHDDAQSLTVAAVLNWVAVIHRRAGYPRRGLALLDAALSVCAPGDDDNRADIHYNRAYCRLQAVLASRAGAESADAPFNPVLTDPEARVDLDPVRRDFELAARLNPEDAHAWAQLGIVAQLLGEASPAEEAWLQAATRARDPEVQRQMLVNAEAAKVMRW